MYPLEESLQWLGPAGHSLVDCYVPLVVFPVSLGSLSLLPLRWPGVEPLKVLAEVYLPMGYWFPSAVLPARYGLTRFPCLQTEPLPRGGFAFLGPSTGLEVVRVEAEDRALRLLGVPPVVGVAFSALPDPQTAA